MLQKTDKELQLIGSMGALKPLFFLLSVPSLSGGKNIYISLSLMDFSTHEITGHNQP